MDVFPFVNKHVAINIHIVIYVYKFIYNLSPYINTRHEYTCNRLSD